MGADNLNSFIRGVRLDGKRIPAEQISIVHRKICLDLTSKVVFRTPVDTGRARMNWQPSRGAPAEGVIGERGERFPGAGSSVMGEATSQVFSLKPFDVYFLTNNLPYIERLAEGHSPQAKDGEMIDQSLAEIEESLRSLG